MTNTTILRGVVGSHAYGLNRAGSDVDRLGIYVTPASEIAGWGWNSHHETVTNASPEGDDTTEHEVRKFLRLAVKANPTVSELLWLDDYEVEHHWGKSVVALRFEMLSSRAVQAAYLGYARAQMNKFSANSKPKFARHTLRLLRQGKELLTTGNLTLRVSDPQEYFDLETMEFGEVLEILTDEMKSYDEIETFALRDEPNLDLVRNLLSDIRENHLL